MNFLLDPVNAIANWLRTLFLGWGVPPDVASFLLSLLGAGILATGAMLWVIFLIWYERKLLGRIQDRFGPNRLGPWGVFQPIADMLKIFTKEYITPQGADKFLYNLAPVLSVASVLMMWVVVPFAVTIYGVDLNVGILYIVAVGALGELAIIMAGLSSNNKYAMLGAFRVVAQLISYEVPMVISLLVPVMLARTMSMNGLVIAQDAWYLFTAPLAALIFMITQVAEVGRAPFDLVEAESEIVAGYNIEYSGLKFGMFYVAEFLHAFTVSLIFATVFLGGWRGPSAEQMPILGFLYYAVKVAIVYFIFILLRGSLPRFRIDQMMDLNWKLLTPLSIAVLAVSAVVDKLLQSIPVFWNHLALFAANVVILWISMTILNRRFRREQTRVAGLEARPARAVQEHISA
jgi:NADH-quinone oxidoreductase subunit H